MTFSFTTAGESHGRALIATIEGLPAGLAVDQDFINHELWRRQQGYGRGGRMKIETDTTQILAGVRHGETLGSPVAITVENRDFKNWLEVMATERPQQPPERDRKITRPRPGHADLVGGMKYDRRDLRDVLERASARETTMRVAVGAFAKLLLREFGVEVASHVIRLGEISIEDQEVGWAHAHFREDQHAALLGDKIDLAQAAAPVSLHQAQSRRAQEIGAQVLGSRALGIHGTLNELENPRLTGTLYVVATPIGNLADASPRSIEALKSADLIACEDTRTTRTLLARHGIAARTVALHSHNERRAAGSLIAALREGKTVALVSDAGTPALSDPGAWLVAEAHRAGIRVSPLPGPSAAAAALSVCGFAAPSFLFAGFLPTTRTARRKALDALDLPFPVVIYEAPHRIAETIEDLQGRFGDAREVLMGRELTKKFEEVARMPLGKAAGWLTERPERLQGEFVLVLQEGAASERPAMDPEKVLAILREALAPSEAARLAAKITGAAKNALYRKTLKS